MQDVLWRMRVVEDRNLRGCGEYRPDLDEIAFNPDKAPRGSDEFYLTIFHEIIHEVDFLSQFTEEEVEYAARSVYQDINLRGLVDYMLEEQEKTKELMREANERILGNIKK